MVHANFHVSRSKGLAGNWPHKYIDTACHVYYIISIFINAISVCLSIVCLPASQILKITWQIEIRFSMRAWCECEIIDTYLELKLLYFWSICLSFSTCANLWDLENH